jgi:hypothetical protein
MDTWVWILIAVVVVLIVLGAIGYFAQRRRTQGLQDRFGGSEYDRTLETEGGRRSAERELREREKRHEELDLRPLSPEARRGFQQEWEETQHDFVDDPKGAVARADKLVQRVMRERGYPVDDFDRRAADISVEHPDLVEKYRTADGIARASERGEASTEDLRHSVRHYRALFNELLGTDVDGASSRDGDKAVARERDNVESSR